MQRLTFQLPENPNLKFKISQKISDPSHLDSKGNPILDATLDLNEVICLNMSNLRKNILENPDIHYFIGTHEVHAQVGGMTRKVCLHVIVCLKGHQLPDDLNKPYFDKFTNTELFLHPVN